MPSFAAGSPAQARAAVLASLLIAAGGIVIAYAGGSPGIGFDVAWTGSALAATIGTLAARRRAQRQNRARWTLWGVATGCWLAGQVMWNVYGVTGYPRDPNLADAFWWAFALLIAVSMVRIPRAARSVLAVAAAESIPLICAAIALCLSLLWRTAEHSQLALAPELSDLTYPCLYASAAILSLQAMLAGALRGQWRRSLILVLGGTGAIAVAFMLWSRQLLQGTYVPGTSILDPLWVVGLSAIAVGGLLAAADPEDAPHLSEPGQLGVLLPAGMFIVLVATLVIGRLSGAPDRASDILVLGTLCSGVALIVRSSLLAGRMRGLLTRERATLASLVAREAELARLNEQLVEDSRHDALTGIGNRRALADDLPMYRTLQRESEQQIAVLLCDVDHFKSYNDRFGHLAGDQALSMIAATARGALRAGDTAYRFGGEELLLILRDADLAAAVAVAERVRAAVQHAGFTHPLAEAGVLTVSIGFACGLQAPEELLELADDALYAAKNAGRNRIQVADGAHRPAGRGRRREREPEGPTPRHLRGMLAVSRAAASAQGEMAILEALADVIHRELSFNVVAVNLRETADAFRTVVVLGEPAARELLLGRPQPQRDWDMLAAAGREIHGATWLVAGSYDDDTGTPTWRPNSSPPLTTDGWHPDDMLLLPLRGRSEEILGFLSVDQPVLGRRPSEAEIGVLMAVVDHAALAVEQAQLQARAPGEESDELRLAAVMLLAEALDLRDPSTARHSQTVGRLARLTAGELGMSAAQTERVHAAGVVHDLGKLGIADSILHKPGPLDDAEWREMRRHPEVGARILEHAGMRDIAAWVRAHHERIDGGGYPLGLADEQISRESRILSVADSYEAMIANRPYRSGMDPHDARAELQRCAGSQFDPEVVAAFLRALDADEAAPPADEQPALMALAATARP